MGKMCSYLWKGNKTPEGFPQFTVGELCGQPQVLQGDTILPPDDDVDGDESSLMVVVMTVMMMMVMVMTVTVTVMILKMVIL